MCYSRQRIFKYDTNVDVGVKLDIFGFGYFPRCFGLEGLSQKRICQVMFSNKVPSAE